MISVWCDTETTGLDPRDSGAFELAFLVYDGAQLLEEKTFNLNPLNEEVKFGEEAFQTNGVPEEVICSYPPAEDVVPEIVEFLVKYAASDKLLFAGYKCGFDFGHLGALLFRCGFFIKDYFTGEFIDVLELVKKAAERGLLPKTQNKKLETMSKALKIEHGDAHTAMADIKATRRIYEAIYRLMRGGKP